MTGDSTNSVGCQLPRLWGSPQTLFPPSCEDALLIGPRVEDWLRKQDQSQSQVHRTETQRGFLALITHIFPPPLYPDLLPGMPISGPDAERR
jgi:hypothetical protein